MGVQPQFEEMMGFHKLLSFWKINYRVITLEPFLTVSTTEESKAEVGDIIGKTLPKPELDAVPLVMNDKAVITGNAVKGVFRHLISAQLTQAKIPVCVQRIKMRPEVEGKEAEWERIAECKPDAPCFSCTWFGTPGRQGALHFSFLESVAKIDEVLIGEPIPMVALGEDSNALIAIRGIGRFALLAPVKSDVEFSGWIKGENLNQEILGAIKEVKDMSEKGFVQFGGFKTRGFGSVKIEILKVEKYKTVPFGLEKAYDGDELKQFLEECQRKYHSLLAKGGSA